MDRATWSGWSRSVNRRRGRWVQSYLSFRQCFGELQVYQVSGMSEAKFAVGYGMLGVATASCSIFRLALEVCLGRNATSS